MRVASLDLETTGTNPETCQIIEIGIVIDDLDNQKPLDELPYFHTFVRHELYTGQPFALQLNARIFKALSNRETPSMDTKQAAGALHEFFSEHFGDDKVTLLGKNVGTFDYRFFMADPHLRRVAERFFRHRMIDIGTLFLQPDDDQVPGTEECMRRANLCPFVTHEALQDCKDAISAMRVWVGRQRMQAP